MLWDATFLSEGKWSFFNENPIPSNLPYNLDKKMKNQLDS